MNTKVKVIKASNTGARNRNSLHLDLKRVAAYCWVSTDSKDQLESYKSQVDYYTNLIKNNKNWTLAGIYADEATTGTTTTKRADFMRLNGWRVTINNIKFSSSARSRKYLSPCKKGLKMKMEKGELIGFQGCLGYDYDPTTKSLSINEEEAKIVRYIFKR